MKRCRILLVEDNTHLRETLSEVLTEAGLHVVTAEGAEDAGLALRSQAFDLLVTDINLERPLAGLEVADAWRAHEPDAPLVFATAYPRADIRTRLRLRATDGYLTKPFTSSELIALIDYVLQARARRLHPLDQAGTEGAITHQAPASAADTVPWIA